jgi:hypothetical protein
VSSRGGENEESKVGQAFKQTKEEAAQLEEQKKMHYLTETVSKNVNWDEGAEGIIKRNLLVGNLEYAAEVALKCGRTTEAMLIAEAGGEKLLERIKEEYFMNCKDSYVKLFLRSIVQEEFKEIISNQALQFKGSNWKESLAYLLSYVEGNEQKELLGELGEELLKKKDVNFMGAEGLKSLAMKYLELANPKQANIAMLKDRVFHSDSTRQVQRTHAKPPQPYQIEKLKIWKSVY